MQQPPSPPPNSRWQSIRPWSSMLSLHAREITSVSAMFILASTPSKFTKDNDVPALAHSDEDDEDDFDSGDETADVRRRNPSSISRILRRGLAVKVNGLPWQTVVMNVDELDEEATVLIYGLLPGRQYEIDFGVVSRQHSNRATIVTNDESALQGDNNDLPAAEAPVQQPIVVTSSIQTATPEDTPPSSPVTRPAPPKTITVEERLAQLRHTLATTNAERESVSSQLKVARRESQRAEAAIRSELDGLKRASEKSALADQRARQKTLALQEATKQSLAAAADAEEQVRLVEDSLPQLNARSKAVEMEHRKLKREAARSSCEADEAIKADKKRITDLEAELATLGNRLDKLKHKKEKFVNDTVPQLEEQLASLAKEMEQIEKGTVPLHELNEFDHETLYPHHYAVPAFVPHHPHPPTNMTRPSPIQRPVPHQTLNYPVNPLPTPSEPRGLPIPQPFYSPAHFVPRTPVAIAPLNGRSPPRHGIRTSTGSSNEGGFVSPISPARSSNPFGNGPVRSNINNSSNAIRRPSK